MGVRFEKIKFVIEIIVSAMQMGDTMVLFHRHLSHDNIVAFRGMGRLDADVKAHNLKADAHFIVMEYIPNNLKRYVERQTTHESKGLPLYLVWDFARQIANGLEYLHTMGDPFKPIAHRDLKPDNILVSKSTRECILGAWLLLFIVARFIT